MMNKGTESNVVEKVSPIDDILLVIGIITIIIIVIALICQLFLTLRSSSRTKQMTAEEFTSSRSSSLIYMHSTFNGSQS